MGGKHLEVTEHKVSTLKKKSNLFVHFMFADKVAVMEHDLISPPVYSVYCHRLVLHVQWRAAWNTCVLL